MPVSGKELNCFVDDFSVYSEAQKKAICCYRGPVIVIAGPGSGKTKVLTARVRYLISEKKVNPSSILVITFTKAAATSMQQRFYQEMGRYVPQAVFGTFHALCFQILKQYFRFSADCLLSCREKNHFSKIAFNKLVTAQSQKIWSEEIGEALLEAVSRYKNGMEPEKLCLPGGVETADFLSFFSIYQEIICHKGKLDFDDMIYRTLALLRQNTAARKYWQEKFSFILVDEFQDCNGMQYELLRLLAGDSRNLFVVGDDDQSIYGFRGAGDNIMQRFVRDYPGCGKIFLEINFRSHADIVTAAGKVIAPNTKRFKKKILARQTYDNSTDTAETVTERVRLLTFTTEKEEAQYLAACCKRAAQSGPPSIGASGAGEKTPTDGKQPMQYADMAMIARTNRELNICMSALKKENIPYIVHGNSAGGYAHFAIQDILSYCRLVMEDYSRRNFICIMNKPDRKLSRDMLWAEEVDIQAVKKELQGAGNREAFILLERWEKQLEICHGLPPSAIIKLVRKRMGYDTWLRAKAGKNTEYYEEWLGILDALEEEAAFFDTPEEWMMYMEEQKKENRRTAKNPDQGVHLMTLHASKGLEFSYVAILNVNEGKLPHGKLPSGDTVEEERRLLYVGMTRAKERLDICYLTGTKEYPYRPSRLLEPLL